MPCAHAEVMTCNRTVLEMHIASKTVSCNAMLVNLHNSRLVDKGNHLAGRTNQEAAGKQPH